METLKNQILNELEAHAEKTNYWIGSVDEITKDYLCATVSKNGELKHVIEYPLESLSTEQHSNLEIGASVRFEIEENKIEILKSDNTWIV